MQPGNTSLGGKHSGRQNHTAGTETKAQNGARVEETAAGSQLLHSYTLAGTPAWTWQGLDTQSRSWSAQQPLRLCLSPAEPKGKRNQGNPPRCLPQLTAQRSHSLAASASGTAAAAARTEPESSCGMRREWQNPQFTVHNSDLHMFCCSHGDRPADSPHFVYCEPRERCLVPGQERASSNTCCSDREWGTKRRN